MYSGRFTLLIIFTVVNINVSFYPPGMLVWLLFVLSFRGQSAQDRPLLVINQKLIQDIHPTANYLRNGVRLTQVRILFVSYSATIWGNYLNFLSPGLLYNEDNDNIIIISFLVFFFFVFIFDTITDVPIPHPHPLCLLLS